MLVAHHPQSLPHGRRTQLRPPRSGW